MAKTLKDQLKEKDERIEVLAKRFNETQARVFELKVLIDRDDKATAIQELQAENEILKERLTVAEKEAEEGDNRAHEFENKFLDAQDEAEDFDLLLGCLGLTRRDLDFNRNQLTTNPKQFLANAA